MSDEEYKYLGDLSATPPWFTVHMSCDKCRVSWGGCWDNFQCPVCGDGELPSAERQNGSDNSDIAQIKAAQNQ